MFTKQVSLQAQVKVHIFRDSEVTAELWRRAWNEAEINLIEKLRAFLHNFLEEREKKTSREWYLDHFGQRWKLTWPYGPLLILFSREEYYLVHAWFE